MDNPIDLSRTKYQKKVKLLLINLLSDPKTTLQRVAMYPDQDGKFNLDVTYYKDEHKGTTDKA